MIASSASDLTPQILSEKAWEIYRASPAARRIAQKYRPLICPFERLIPWIPKSGKILDAGCGNGLLLLLLTSLDYPIDALGVDRSAPALDVARHAGERLLEAGRSARLRFVRVSEDGVWPGEDFDAVTLVDVMHHVPPAHQHAFLKQAASRVAAGGRLIYKDVGMRPLWRASASRLHDLIVTREWIHFRAIREIESWCGDWNLKLIHSEDINRLWYGHELRVFQKAAKY